MSKPKTGFKVKYLSLALLSQDHEEYLTHGGLLLPKKGKLPDTDALLTIRIETPVGAYFDLPSRVIRQMPGMGFAVAFEPGARSTQHALDEMIASPAFKQAVAAEGHISGTKKTVVILSPDTLAPPAASKPARPLTRPDFEEEATLPGLLEPNPLGEPDDESLDAELLAGALDDPEGSLQDPLDRTLDEHDPDPDAFARPPPGETFPVFALRFSTLLDYLAVHDKFARKARMTISHANETEPEGTVCQLRLTLPGAISFSMFAVLDRVEEEFVSVRVNPDDPAYIGAIAYPRTHKGQQRLTTEREDHRRPVQVLRLQDTHAVGGEDGGMPLRRRLQRMSMEEKINLALSGNREERMALATDSNKAIHHYLLKNRRLSLDEIAFMARSPSLNPDVLKKIAENPMYTQNPQVVRNLVFNPKTPVKVSVRLIDRLPRNDVQIISRRTSMNRALVAAAQKKLRGRA